MGKKNQTDKRTLVTFFGKALGLYALWFLIYESWLKDLGTVDDWLTLTVTEQSVAVLKWLGYNAAMAQDSVWTSVMCDGVKLVNVADSCNGLVLYALYIGFFIAFPGRWVYKSRFIFFGFISIYLLNLARVVALSLIQMYYPSYLDFSHKYAFTLLVYACIFGLWWWWVNRYSLFAFSQSSVEEKIEEAVH